MAEAKAEERAGPPKILYIHHLARDPRAKMARKLRPGNRQGFVLSNGARIRRKGKRRPTILPFERVIQNIDEICRGVRESYIKVYADGELKKLVSLEELESLRQPRVLKAIREAMAAKDEAVIRENEALAAEGRAKEREVRIEAAKAAAEKAELAAEKAAEAYEEVVARIEEETEDDVEAAEAAAKLREEREEREAEEEEAARLKAEEETAKLAEEQAKGEQDARNQAQQLAGLLDAAETLEDVTKMDVALREHLAPYAETEWGKDASAWVENKVLEKQEQLKTPDDQSSQDDDKGSQTTELTGSGETEKTPAIIPSEEVLRKMRRKELNELATAVEIPEPEALANIGEVVDALLTVKERKE